MRVTALIVAISLAAAIPALADPSPAVYRALMNTMQQHSYHVTMSSKAMGVAQGDFVSPGKMHMVMKNTETYVIGDSMYMKMNGKWSKFGGAGVMPSQSDVMKKMQADHADYSSTDLGMRVVNGIPYHAYSLFDSKKNFRQTMFVDSAGRIGRMEFADTVMEFSRFGENVSITPPM